MAALLPSHTYTGTLRGCPRFVALRSFSRQSPPLPHSAGFSLVELVLLMGVLALLAIAAFILFSSVQVKTQVKFEGQRLTHIVAGVHSLFAGRNSYTGLTTGVGNQARAFPATMNAGNFSALAPITDVWGGAVTLAPFGNPSTRFVVRYAAVPSAMCISWLPVSAALFAQVRVGVSEVVVHDSTATSTSGNHRLDVEAAVQACSENETVPIEWISY